MKFLQWLGSGAAYVGRRVWASLCSACDYLLGISGALILCAVVFLSIEFVLRANAKDNLDRVPTECACTCHLIDPD